jgi:hypothetical protein
LFYFCSILFYFFYYIFEVHDSIKNLFKKNESHFSNLHEFEEYKLFLKVNDNYPFDKAIYDEKNKTK